jgi:type I restriction enzyme, S subunit
MKLNPYPEYKDSGVEWIGEIPKEWNIQHFKRLTTRIDVGIAEAATHAYRDEGVPILRSGNIKKGKIKDESLLFIDQGFANKNLSKYLKTDDLLTVRTGEAGATAVVPNEYNQAHCFTMLISTLKRGLEPKYFSYFLNSHSCKAYFNINAWGTAQKNISVPILGFCPVPSPDFDEQIKIVNFLNQKISEIDLTIEKDTRLIELLKEKRTALINHVVTKGLDSTVKMNDSGVEWIGEIPEKAEIIPFRRICNLNQGLQFPQAERLSKPDGNSKIYITIKYIHSNKELKEYIPNPPKRVVCKEDDVLLARTGATGEVVTDQEGVFHNNFFRINYDNNVNKNYLVYYLKMEAIKELLLLKAGVTTIPDLNHDDFLDTPFIMYPLDEQERLVGYLDNENLRINSIIQKIHQNIELLEEYKKSLIHHVVTGKVDVREVAV